MARAPKWLSLLILVQLAGSGNAAEPASVRAQRVESGLRPAIVLDELAAERFRLSDRMKFYKVPGVSIAVIDQGEIAWARGYGVRQAGTETPVTTDTLFQAASISKPVAAVVALRLVEQGTLQLDEDVNRYLRSWKLPENEFTAQQKVTLRLLLSHRAGLTDYAGFKDALPNQRRPTLREMLETGKWTPAPIRVGLKPASRFAYSGGGYCLLEQLLEDVTGKPFPTLARELLLEPLQMASSSFDQAFTHQRRSLAAVGHQWNGKKLSRDWNDYPATSAAGLWTTASDLARFAIELQKAKAASDRSILSPAGVAEMLSIQGGENDRDSKVIALKEAIAEQPPPSWGLGIGLIGRPPTRFFHSGSNPGYQCELQAYLQGGQGAVVMTNGDQGWRLARELLWAIAKEYGWPGYEYRPEIKKVARLSQDELERFVGRYQISFSRPSRWTLDITRSGDRLTARIMDDAHEVRLYPESNDRCFTVEDAMNLSFANDKTGSFADVTSDLGWSAQRKSD
jgi:CubicO group peptidase (beta-lactamase class C family)